MEIRISASESTISALSHSSDSTIPYALDQDEISITIDESSDGESMGELWTHHYVTDQAPAPYAESLISEESESNHILPEELECDGVGAPANISNHGESLHTVRTYSSQLGITL